MMNAKRTRDIKKKRLGLCNILSTAAPGFTVRFWIDPELPNLAGAGGGGGLRGP